MAAAHASSGRSALAQLGDCSVTATACVASCGDVRNGRPNRSETIKESWILDHDLAVDDGELTPSLMVRRKVTASRSRPLLDSVYNGQRHG